MKLNKFLVKSCLTFLLIVAFAAVSYAGFDLYGKTSTIWISPSIPVCWENTSGSFNNEKNWVRDAVSNSWQKVSAVNFPGWNSCVGNSKGIRIQIDDQGPHTIGLGAELNGVPNGMVLNFTFKNWSQSCQSTKEQCIRIIAVHEFGHALGFAHEQNRPDTPIDQPGSTKQFCTQEVQGGNGDILIGPWDLNSVMNYCNPRWAGNGVLSETDVAGVQNIYGVSSVPVTIQDLLAIRPFDGKDFGSVSSTQIVSGGDPFRGWNWDGTTASYITVDQTGRSTLTIRPFDGETYGSVSSTQIVSGGDPYRGWSWDGRTASYITVDQAGRSILAIRPFDGKDFGSVSSTQVLSNGSPYRGWSWDGRTASYITVDQTGRSTLTVRLFDGKDFGSVSSSQIASGGDPFRGWSWNGGRASYVVKTKRE